MLTDGCWPSQTAAQSKGLCTLDCGRKARLDGAGVCGGLRGEASCRARPSKEVQRKAGAQWPAGPPPPPSRGSARIRRLLVHHRDDKRSTAEIQGGAGSRVEARHVRPLRRERPPAPHPGPAAAGPREACLVRGSVGARQAPCVSARRSSDLGAGEKSRALPGAC